MSLKDLIKRDIDTVFMNPNDYCDNLVIQVGTMRFPIVGSLQSNVVENNSGNGQPLQNNSWTLYCKYPIIAPKPKADFGNVDNNDPMILWNILSAGTRITIGYVSGWSYLMLTNNTGAEIEIQRIEYTVS